MKYNGADEATKRTISRNIQDIWHPVIDECVGDQNAKPNRCFCFIWECSWPHSCQISMIDDLLAQYL